MSELAKRWAVAAVGVPVVLLLLYLGGWPIAALVSVFAGLGAWECYRLAERAGVAALDGLGVASAAALVLAAAWRPTFAGFAPLALALLGSLTVVALVVAMRVRGPARKPLEVVAITVFGALYAGLSLAFVPLLHALPTVSGWGGANTGSGGGMWVVGLTLAATWVGDAVALYAGRAWGRGGLAPSISPKKSWVGVWVGLAGAGAASALWWFAARPFLPGMPIQGPLVAALVGIVLSIGAILGDLAESLLKRGAGVKDSGALLPGHGGVLDRLDALTFTFPATYAMFALLESLS